MSLFFRLEIGTQVWWARSSEDTRWTILKRRYTESSASVSVEYFLEAVRDENVTGWAYEPDIWSVEEVPNS